MRRLILRLSLFALFVSVPTWVATVSDAVEMDLDSAAAHFGQRAAVWGMRLSPDGQKVSFLRLHPDGFPIAMVIHLKTGKGNLVLASDAKKGVNIVDCQWANDTRLLCTYFGTWDWRGNPLPATRLVAVDIDGKNSEVLTQRQQKKNDQFALNQSQIVDLLPDDPSGILLQIRKNRGRGISRVDIDKNKLKTVEIPKPGVWSYGSDGRGEIRFRTYQDRSWIDYEYRLAGEKRWRRLRRIEPEGDRNAYEPASIEPGSNDLLVFDWHEGRRALFRERLIADEDAERNQELVYSHDNVDVAGLVSIGKYQRAIGVAYRTDKTHVEYFDARIKSIDAIVSEELAGQAIEYVDESWDGRFYLVHSSSDVDAGAYYRFDSKTAELSRIASTHPWLDELELAEMESMHYQAEEGVSVQGFVTRPPNSDGPHPLVVFPHGGPWSQDTWGYDRLPQFFAARGYVVLQANYRGSTGYGKAWEGEGGIKGWRNVVSDIDAGVQHLIDAGIADPDRICAVGWSFGGYAALLSAVEVPNRYRCAVSVAGVSHPKGMLGSIWYNSTLHRRFLRNQIPTKGEDVVKGSPLKRAHEITVPVLLFHGDRDLNVDVSQSRALESSLRKAKKAVDYIEYEGADHFILRQDYRIDMLQRIGDFLDEHLHAEAPEKK